MYRAAMRLVLYCIGSKRWIWSTHLSTHLYVVYQSMQTGMQSGTLHTGSSLFFIFHKATYE